MFSTIQGFNKAEALFSHTLLEGGEQRCPGDNIPPDLVSRKAPIGKHSARSCVVKEALLEGRIVEDRYDAAERRTEIVEVGPPRETIL